MAGWMDHVFLNESFVSSPNRQSKGTSLTFQTLGPRCRGCSSHGHWCSSSPRWPWRKGHTKNTGMFYFKSNYEIICFQVGVSKTHLPISVFGLQSLGLDDVDPDQTVLDAVGRQLLELPGRSRSWRVVWHRVDLKHTLITEEASQNGFHLINTWNQISELERWRPFWLLPWTLPPLKGLLLHPESFLCTVWMFGRNQRGPQILQPSPTPGHTPEIKGKDVIKLTAKIKKKSKTRLKKWEIKCKRKWSQKKESILSFPR